jgi:hypothetical protein
MNDYERIRKLLKKLDVAFYVRTDKISYEREIRLMDVGFSFLFDLIDGEIIKILEWEKG